MGVIRDIDKGGGEIIRVEISEFRGQNYLNLRVWYTDKESGDYKPTQKGIAIRPELYPEIKAAILDAEGALGGMAEPPTGE
ncbi:MAG: transcriptional coactivator p15/PC4 family protein [bacterium]|nr:transcriptional coactivator p15/PC4 family protein [bacterium]